MNEVKHNVLANFVGNGWTALLGLFFIPFYIYYLGMEAYGLIGIFAILQTIIGLLDMGIGTTVNRELAGLSGQNDKAQEMRDIVRTLEVIYWGIGIVFGLSILVLSKFIASKWLVSVSLSPLLIKQTLILMGIAAVLQYIISFYSGGLIGLQKQVLINAINICMATLRSVGGLLILWLVSPTIKAFFIWQLIVSILQTFLLIKFLWYCLPKTNMSARFQSKIVRNVWRFSTSMGGIYVMAIGLSQIDKIILSKLLPLNSFGYYTLANVLAGNLNRLSSPLTTALFPRFSQLIADGDHREIKRLYHFGCQVMSIMVLPIAVMAVFFSTELLLLWTSSFSIAENTWCLLSLLIIGTSLSTLVSIPSILQYAYGQTKLIFISNLLSLIFLVPLTYLMILKYGAIGAAIVWIILNSVYVFIVVQIMHRYILKGEQWKWYFEDVGLPLVGALLPVSFAKYFIDGQMLSPHILLIYLLGLLLLTIGMSTLGAPYVRVWIKNKVFHNNKHKSINAKSY